MVRKRHRRKIKNSGTFEAQSIQNAGDVKTLARKGRRRKRKENTKCNDTNESIENLNVQSVNNAIKQDIEAAELITTKRRRRRRKTEDVESVKIVKKSSRKRKIQDELKQKIQTKKQLVMPSFENIQEVPFEKILKYIRSVAIHPKIDLYKNAVFLYLFNHENPLDLEQFYSYDDLVKISSERFIDFFIAAENNYIIHVAHGHVRKFKYDYEIHKKPFVQLLEEILKDRLKSSLGG